MIQIFDDIIKKTTTLLDMSSVSGEKLRAGKLWENGEKSELILRSDMAYELGGSSLWALSGLFFTSDLSLAGEEGVCLYGPELHDIHADAPYARMTFVGMDKEAMQADQSGYDLMKRIEYTRYRMNLSGYMMRISTSKGREMVRVSKQALSEGMDFAGIGSALNMAYHSCPGVKRVRTCFITDPHFDYKALEHLVTLSAGVMESLNQIFKNLQMDCGSCGLRQVCDEVEGLKELHFASIN
jgi:CO dehydrogenase/acetyl-CoA synthase beta subunit